MANRDQSQIYMQLYCLQEGRVIFLDIFYFFTFADDDDDDDAFFILQTLRLAGAAMKTTTVGEIVNLMAVDAQKLQDMCAWSIFLYQVL